MNDLEQAVEKLLNAQKVAVLTGAGVSKESGIPTFRDAQTGMWAQYNPEDLATREGFLRDPKMVWEWYDFRRNKVWDTQPNPGHYALAEMESMFPSFTLITQNIDNLHRQAGSENVLELHGNIFRYKCLDANHPISMDLLSDEAKAQAPPHCPQCNSYVRPDVVWFGEMLPPFILEKAFEASQQTDLMLIVGTSGVVHPAASLPVAAKQSGAFVIEVNPEESALTPYCVDLFLQGPSGKVLDELLNAMKAKNTG